MKRLQERVYLYTNKITRGRVFTYNVITKSLGNMRYVRLVGTILGNNTKPAVVPCHRVVHVNGRIGGYSFHRGVKEKIRLLRLEGIEIDNGRLLNFERVLFRNFESS